MTRFVEMIDGGHAERLRQVDSALGEDTRLLAIGADRRHRYLDHIEIILTADLDPVFLLLLRAVWIFQFPE